MASEEAKKRTVARMAAEVTAKTRLSPKQWQDKMWAAAIEAQSEEIKKAHGAKVSKSANYGWGDASNNQRIDISTKVYVDPTRILTTTAEYPSLELQHAWKDYSTIGSKYLGSE